MDKTMKLGKVISALEERANPAFQDDFDNSGLQVGSPQDEVSNALVCLDITEDILEEAADTGCDLIVSHHPLIFKALRQVSDATYQQRCVTRAVRQGIAIYSAHTSLDNAPGGVNHMMARMIGLDNTQWLLPRTDGVSGSGLTGELAQAEDYAEFLDRMRKVFGVKALRCSGQGTDRRKVRKVALCGGAGAFLLPNAIAAGADCFVCGEFHYHDYFENSGVLLVELGHYQSEQFTMQLLQEILLSSLPDLETVVTKLDTNPINYI